MLACISCSKQVAEGDEDDEATTPRTKVAAKSFPTQIKEMAQKLKPCAGSMGTSYKKGGRPFPEFDAREFGGSVQHRAQNSQAPFNNRQVNGEDGCKEWMAQVEPGVHITFAALSDGGNDLRRIRFSRGMFDKWEAQRWWGENYDRVLELYNVQRFNRQALQTPLRSEDGRDSSYSRLGSLRDTSPMMTPREYYNKPYGYQHQAGSSGFHGRGEASMDTSSRTSSRDEVESEWVEEDEPGVYVTVRQMVDGIRELRRVRFSRERFVEVDAKRWWEENKDRIQAQYL